MREIIFRGKRKDNSKWIIGNLIHQLDYYGTPCDRYFMTGKHDCVDYDIGEPVEIIPETVGQYTGLKDKNDKMIFEGDILHQAYHKENDFVVVFSDGGFRVSYLYESPYHDVGFSCTTFCQQNLTGNSFGKYAIISSIHDQKEDV